MVIKLTCAPGASNKGYTEDLQVWRVKGQRVWLENRTAVGKMTWSDSGLRPFRPLPGLNQVNKLLVYMRLIQLAERARQMLPDGTEFALAMPS
jgi:hypothetical protein